MIVKFKRVSRIIAFLLINPHLLILSALDIILRVISRTLYFFSDKFDDAARITSKLIRIIHSKDWPQCFKSLIE
jgi:hypothetical protein